MSDLYRAKDQDITHVEYVKYLKYPFSSASGRDKETEEWAKSERYVTGTRLQDVSTWNHLCGDINLSFMLTKILSQ